LLHRLASIRALGLSTGELDARPEEVKKRGFELARKMVDEDGAEVIIMGCTAMAGYSTDLERQLQVPILDPTIVAFKYAEMIAHLGISHSRIGLYHPPMPKKFESKK
jgi:allantoin racemase